MSKIYDLAILGAGPGGMTAAIYAKRSGLDVCIIEKSVAGGAIATTYEVANYPGFISISGPELSQKMLEHTQSLNVDFIWEEVKTVNVEGEIKKIECYNSTIEARAVVLAYGASVRKLNLPNERSFVGKGISYCATCDGALFKDKVVAIVGGGNTALEDCYFLSNLAKKVYLIHRRDEFRGDDILIKQIKEKDNIELVLNSTVTGLTGDSVLTSIQTTDKVTTKTREIELDGLFVCIGRGPDTEMVNGDLNLSSNGYIITDENMKTNYDGVYAVGDIRQTPLRQIVTACGDGAIAATKVLEYIRSLKAKQKQG